MPASDFDPRQLTEVHYIREQGRWRVAVTYAVAKALSSPLKRDMRRLSGSPEGQE
jgi:hypothetical protein